jgi:hypothetical protein
LLNIQIKLYFIIYNACGLVVSSKNNPYMDCVLAAEVVSAQQELQYHREDVRRKIGEYEETESKSNSWGTDSCFD